MGRAGLCAAARHFASSMVYCYESALALSMEHSSEIQCVESSFHVLLLVCSVVLYFTVVHKCDPALNIERHAGIVRAYWTVPSIAIVCAVVSASTNNASQSMTGGARVTFLFEFGALYMLSVVCYRSLLNSASPFPDQCA